nr:MULTISPECIES: hypothetical protein [Vibrionaceae]
MVTVLCGKLVVALVAP